SPWDAASTSKPSIRKFTSSSRRIAGASSTSRMRGMLVSIRAAAEGSLASLPRLAPVAQWIECRPPEPEAQVRVLPGAHRASAHVHDPYDADMTHGLPADHEHPALHRADLDPDPLAQCRAWLAEAETAG